MLEVKKTIRDKLPGARVIAKIEWHAGELFPRIGFIVTNSRLSAGKVVKVYNGRGDVENRIKEGKNTLRWDKTSCHRFAANQPGYSWGLWPITSCTFSGNSTSSAKKSNGQWNGSSSA